MTENENIIAKWLGAWKEAKAIPPDEIKGEIAVHQQAVKNLQMLLPAASSDSITGTVAAILKLLMSNPKIAALTGIGGTIATGGMLAPAGTGGGILSNILSVFGIGG